MSEAIQKVAGNKLRQTLSTLTQKRVFSVFTGFIITAIIQSSSATTVMTVSFVNAGLLSLTESIGVIMGANIGTTVTAWLISIFGFGKLAISSLSFPIIAVGLPLMLSSRSRLKSFGEVLIGFAILFLGLSFLKETVPDIRNNPEVLNFLGSFAQSGILSTILFVIVGTIVTIVVQSSSAAMALTLALLYNGVINFEIAAAMVLGENIGTTITANIAALVANVHAKRTARAHFIFNVFGVMWMLIFFPLFIDFIKSIWEPFYKFISGFNSNLAQTSEELQLALFHSLFNIINLLLLVAFVPQMARVVKHMVKSKTDEDESFRLDYLSSNFVVTPELSLLEAKKEIAKYGGIALKMGQLTRKLLLTPEYNKAQRLIKQLKSYEQLTDQIEEEVTNYLMKVSTNQMSDTTSKRVRGMIAAANDLESIGDIFYQMAKNIERKSQEKLWFIPEQRNQLLQLFDEIEKAFDIMMENIKADAEQVNYRKAMDQEDNINTMRNKMRKKHLKNLEQGEYTTKSGMVYSNLFSSLERVGDHIINVSESLTPDMK